MPCPTWGSIPKERPVYLFLQTWHLHKNNFFPFSKFSESDPMTSYCQNRWNNSSFWDQFSQKWTLTILDVLTPIFNTYYLRLIIYLTFCCFALILLLVDSKEEYWVLIFSSHLKQSTTFFVITESFHIKAWQEAWWSMEQSFYLFKILAILLLTFEHLFLWVFQFHAYFL